ncbi:MAG: hypothetical protein CME88_16590 [Hirschia sp.]|nr:hypothetical protein [Hirschia sp.]MBF19995.1 hypothetical protein [Hirschia sp.]|tara:strand:- start:331 stop:708 length:378 start_codon:yes stop_codon:yes gene_type:complete
MRAVWVGLFLFTISLLAGAISIALMVYYDNTMLGLIFPLTGVACMFMGEKLLGGMEVKMGQAPGGAGAMLMRSTVSALIMWAVPALGWGGVLAMSDVFVLGFEAAELPRSHEDAALVIMNLVDDK